MSILLQDVLNHVDKSGHPWERTIAPYSRQPLVNETTDAVVIRFIESLAMILMKL